jgi:hypothetical protein
MEWLAKQPARRSESGYAVRDNAYNAKLNVRLPDRDIRASCA